MDAKHFVERDFAEAIDLLTRTQEMLAASNVRLHKITSNCSVVLRAFLKMTMPRDCKIWTSTTTLVLFNAAGSSSIFTFRIKATENLYTHREVLSLVNSLFKPLRLVVPVVIQGKFLLRELTCNEALYWNTSLPDEAEWKMWKDSLQDLQDLRLPRAYTPTTLSTAQRKELNFF